MILFVRKIWSIQSMRLITQAIVDSHLYKDDLDRRILRGD